MKHILLVAGGSPKYWPDITPYLTSETLWIGVDRGSFYLQERGITPDVAVGDFDSLSSEEFKLVQTQAGKVIQAPAEKDETDTQLGLSLAANIASDCPVILIGGTGGRLDHQMANLWMMFEPRYKELLPRFVIKDNQNSLRFYAEGGTYEIQKEADKPYIGFLCLAAVTGLTLTGFKYPLNNYETSMPMSFASNEFLANTGSLTFETGMITVVQSKDQ